MGGDGGRSHEIVPFAGPLEAARRFMQPAVTVEIDTGSASSRGRPLDQIWLVRLRRGDRSIITIGLTRTSAEHLAERITEILANPEEPLDKT